MTGGQDRPAPRWRMNSSVLIAIATYNEMENLPHLVDAIFQHVPDAHVLIVDDNSPDGTGRWADQYSVEDSRVRCVHRPAKLGLGTATIVGMKEAIQRGYEYVVNMDADFSHQPRDLPALIAGMESSQPTIDVMIGSRYRRGGGIVGWPRSRRIMSRFINAYTRFCLRLDVSDCSGSFRCYRVATLQRLDFGRIQSSGYSFFEEILWHLHRMGAQFGELPITFVNRKKGRSKISVSEAVGAVRVITRLGIRARFDAQHD
jgi:dolichol-phosphate mannosyltransferase